MRITRLAALASGLTALAACAAPAAAQAQRPPGVDALVSAAATGHATSIASPQLHTENRDTLVLAFVAAGGGHARQRVTRVRGDGLRWSPVARSDGMSGATEVWSARADHWLTGRIVATLAAAAYPASITVVAYAGSSPYVAVHAAGHGHGSMPKLWLAPVPGSLVWSVGLSQGQRRPVPVTSSTADKRVVYGRFDRRRRTSAWVEVATVPSSRSATAAGASSSGSWSLASVDVVVPSIKKLIEEGVLNAYGPVRRASAASASAAAASAASLLPPGCPPGPPFEVGVQDDPVFMGVQPAMSPERGFELGSEVFHARLLRINVDWGEVKLYGWAPYDRAVQMARERCWTVHMTIMWTPTYAEGFLNSELSARHLNKALLASFAGEIATRYRGKVGRFGIGNEPNEFVFMAHEGEPSGMATYDGLYMSAYNAIRAVDPSAEVIAGEVAGKHMTEWLANLVSLPSNGVGIHPYGQNENVPSFVSYAAPVPVLISEDGTPAGRPDQIAEDLEKEELARRAGAKEFVFYQLSRHDATGQWNTGIE